MAVRTAIWRNKNGSAICYLQLVRNEWDPVTKFAKVRVLHNFGLEGQINRAAVERPTGSLCRQLDPGRAGSRRCGSQPVV